MFDIYINNYPPQPPPPPSHQKKIVPSSRQKKIVPSSRQKKIVSSCRCTHSKVVSRATSSTDRNHSKKVVKSERVTTDKCIEIIPYKKPRGSDNQKVQKKTGVGSKSAVSTFQHNKAFQAMGTVVASHASQGLIDSVEYKEKTTKGGSIKRAMKVNYVKRDGGPSTSRSPPSVPCSFITTTSKKTGRSSVHIIDM